MRQINRTFLNQKYKTELKVQGKKKHENYSCFKVLSFFNDDDHLDHEHVRGSILLRKPDVPLKLHQ